MTALFARLFSSRSSLGFQLLWLLGTSRRYSRLTAAVVPSYLVRQLGVPVVESVVAIFAKSQHDTHSFDLRDR